jgi:hypothetical protein
MSRPSDRTSVLSWELQGCGTRLERSGAMGRNRHLPAVWEVAGFVASFEQIGGPPAGFDQEAHVVGNPVVPSAVGCVVAAKQFAAPVLK